VSKPVHKCPACSRRIKRAPYIALTDRRTRRERRYHGGDCSEAGLREAERRGPDEVVLRFAHPRSCGDPRGKLACEGRCFAIYSQSDVLLATASPGEAKIVKLGEE
jgi:hypothetical protein